MKLLTLDRITWFTTLLAVGVFCPNLHAGWGSLRASNHSSTPARAAAPRSQPQVNRQSEIRQPQPEARPEQPHQEMQPAREQPRSVEHVQPAPAQIDRARAEQADHQRMDIAPERSQAASWSGYRPGMRIDRLPDGYRRIGVRGHDYFYFGGLFYDLEAAAYVIIAPPMGAEIPGLPPGVETVVVGNTIYYYAAGAFYVQQPDGGYIVVAAPIGAVVSLLPPDAALVAINGTTCYQADGIYYSPIMQNGVTAYLTVQQP